MRGPILALAALALLSGCATAPDMRYHTLDMTPSGSAGTLPVNVTVEALRAGQAVRRPEIMVKRSPTEIEYYAEHAWAADVAEVVREKLAAELGPKDPEKPAILVWGTIQAFGQVDTPEGAKPHIKLELAFRLSGTSRYAEPLLEVTYENRPGEEPAVAPPSAKAEDAARAVVIALSGRLADMSREIGRDAARAAAIAERRAP
jgi:hypothetical protein